MGKQEPPCSTPSSTHRSSSGLPALPTEESTRTGTSTPIFPTGWRATTPRWTLLSACCKTGPGRRHQNCHTGTKRGAAERRHVYRLVYFFNDVIMYSRPVG